jgi:nitrogen-specific signal transduction histidine kinase
MRTIDAMVNDREVLSAIVDAVPTPLFIKGADCRLVVANKACEEMWGVDTKGLLRRDGKQYSHDGERGYMPTDREVFDTGDIKVVRETFLSPHGVINLRTTKKPCYDAANKPVCLICTPKIDTSLTFGGKTTLDLDLLHLHRLSTIGMFVSGAAHDVKNVLSGVQGAMTVLRKKVSNIGQVFDRGIFDWLDRVEYSCRHGVSLLEQMLLFSSSNKSFKKEVVSLAEVVERVTNILGIHPALKVSFTGQGGFLVEANVIQLEQMLINLCMNALQAKTKSVCSVTIVADSVEVSGGKLPYISQTVRDGEYCCVSVSDDGAGIATNDIEKIFEPFFSKGKEGNFGLGLSIVRDVVSAHDGYISVHNLEGSGAMFKIYLPQADL